jgi:hypothetical protein
LKRFTGSLYLFLKTIAMQEQSLFDMQIDPISSQELLDTTRAQRSFGIIILSIVGLLALGIAVGSNKIGELVGLPEMENFPGLTLGAILAIIIIVVGVGGCMGWFVFRGATRLTTAIRSKDQHLFNQGLKDLKLFFIIYGIIGIVGLLGNLVALF